MHNQSNRRLARLEDHSAPGKFFTGRLTGAVCGMAGGAAVQSRADAS